MVVKFWITDFWIFNCGFELSNISWFTAKSSIFELSMFELLIFKLSILIIAQCNRQFVLQFLATPHVHALQFHISMTQSTISNAGPGLIIWCGDDSFVEV